MTRSAICFPGGRPTPPGWPVFLARPGTRGLASPPIAARVPPGPSSASGRDRRAHAVERLGTRQLDVGNRRQRRAPVVEVGAAPLLTGAVRSPVPVREVAEPVTVHVADAGDPVITNSGLPTASGRPRKTEIRPDKSPLVPPGNPTPATTSSRPSPFRSPAQEASGGKSNERPHPQLPCTTRPSRRPRTQPALCVRLRRSAHRSNLHAESQAPPDSVGRVDRNRQPPGERETSPIAQRQSRGPSERPQAGHLFGVLRGELHDLDSGGLEVGANPADRKATSQALLQHLGQVDGRDRGRLQRVLDGLCARFLLKVREQRRRIDDGPPPGVARAPLGSSQSQRLRSRFASARRSAINSSARLTPDGNREKRA